MSKEFDSLSANVDAVVAGQASVKAAVEAVRKALADATANAQDPAKLQALSDKLAAVVTDQTATVTGP